MRSYPEDEKDLEELSAEPWQAALLKLNPSYTCWGPYEDYMIKRGDGWDSPLREETWGENGHPIELDSLNEVVNFYFELGRESVKCDVCEGQSYHPDAQWISESFYKHSSPFKSETYEESRVRTLMQQFNSSIGDPSAVSDRQTVSYPSEELLEKYGPEFRAFCEEMREHHCWNDRITQDELDALQAEGRLCDYDREKEVLVPRQVTVEGVNEAQRGQGMGHDGINRWILIEQRCKRLGVPLRCENCEGRGYNYTAPGAHVNLILWVLHPRKGCSRGVEYKAIKREQLPEVFEYLGEAADRNAERFARVVAKAREGR